MKNISHIGICGFKSIATEQSIKLTPLTVVSGTNSGGKSSFFQPLLMVKQTLEAPFDTDGLIINGSHVKFNYINDFLSFTDNKYSRYFYIVIKDEKAESLKILYKKHKTKGIILDRIELFDSMFKQGIELREGEPSSIIMEKIHRGDFKGLPNLKSLNWTVKRNKCFVELNGVSDSKDIGFHVRMPFCQQLIDLCSNILHLPGLRGNPERTYARTAVKNIYTGTFEQYTASIIDEWKRTTQGRDKIAELGRYLSILKLTDEVSTKKINDSNLEILISRKPINNLSSSKKSDFVSIADVGLGVSQALPILTALLVAKRGQYVYVEQPEIHLHPKAQFELAKPFCDAAKRGVSVILETHSSILLRGIQTTVAKGNMPPDDVSLHWFSRDSQTGNTQISSAILDKNGAFGDWPEDFDDATLYAEEAYLDAIESNYEKS